MLCLYPRLGVSIVTLVECIFVTFVIINLISIERKRTQNQEKTQSILLAVNY